MSDMPSVLIIEDTIELAEIIQASLERMGLDIAHETHGDRALETYYAMAPDVILLDIALPDMSGWEVLEQIKAMQEEMGGLPIIIVITAYGDPANRLIGKFQGVYDYLIKPLTPDNVNEIVTRALNDQAG